LFALGCAAASSRLLGLDAMRLAHALALSSFGTNALCTLFSEKRHVRKSLCNGQFAAAGVSAALMSAVGLEGNEDVLGAPYGVLHAWGEQGKRDAINRGLGTEYAIL